MRGESGHHACTNACSPMLIFFSLLVYPFFCLVVQICLASCFICVPPYLLLCSVCSFFESALSFSGLSSSCACLCVAMLKCLSQSASLVASVPLSVGFSFPAPWSCLASCATHAVAPVALQSHTPSHWTVLRACTWLCSTRRARCSGADGRDAGCLSSSSAPFGYSHTRALACSLAQLALSSSIVVTQLQDCSKDTGQRGRRVQDIQEISSADEISLLSSIVSSTAGSVRPLRTAPPPPWDRWLRPDFEPSLQPWYAVSVYYRLVTSKASQFVVSSLGAEQHLLDPASAGAAATLLPRGQPQRHAEQRAGPQCFAAGFRRVRNWLCHCL